MWYLQHEPDNNYYSWYTDTDKPMIINLIKKNKAYFHKPRITMYICFFQAFIPQKCMGDIHVHCCLNACAPLPARRTPGSFVFEVNGALRGAGAAIASHMHCSERLAEF